MVVNGKGPIMKPATKVNLTPVTPLRPLGTVHPDRTKKIFTIEMYVKK